MTHRFQVVPAAYVILRRDAQVLLQLRRGTGYRDGHWACGAAGHVEAGETVLDAAVREAREEAGIDVHPADLRPLTTLHRTHRNGRPVDERVDFFFTCERWGGEPRLVEGDRSAQMRWFPLHGLPAPVVPHELRVLEGLRDGDLPAILPFGFDPADDERVDPS